MTDTLPTNAGLSWTIAAGYPQGDAGAACNIAAGVLTCTDGSMPNGDSFTVRITSPTTAATCGTVDNTANVTTSNDGIAADSASITVNCPDVNVVKTPNDGQVNAGDPASFSIVVSNAGAGTATIVTLNDPLPAPLTWTLGTVTGDISGVACAVNGAPGAQILQCADNDGMTTGQAFTVTVTTTTSSAQCATYPNVATVDATNESNDASATDDNTDSGAITVNRPDVTVLKEADASPVNAGDPIGFTITVGNAGAGVAYDVALTDNLPAGIAWSEDSDACSIAAGVLSCDFGDLAPGASVEVHLTGTTDAADCGTLTNTAVVSASNKAAERHGQQHLDRLGRRGLPRRRGPQGRRCLAGQRR